ncbi:thermonuclease family protein [Tepidamorphus gemmatus]|jgi:micrococcal nuclease|nr:nuclease [Tepidamorphus gemmatus]
MDRLLFLFAAVLLQPCPAALAEPLPGPVPAVVDRIVDGDTIAVRARIWPGQEVRVLVRVRGIDAPERRGRCEGERGLAARAAAAMATALADGGVTLLRVEPDKYGGRVIADVRLGDGGDLASLLLAMRAVRPYHGGVRTSWCAPG